MKPANLKKNPASRPAPLRPDAHNPAMAAPANPWRDQKNALTLRRQKFCLGLPAICIMSSHKAPLPPETRIIIRGVHLDLTDALRAAAAEKAARLLRHQERIIRVRLDLEHDKTRIVRQAFIAKGHIEIRGPDLIASVASDDLYKSLDKLMDKLDRMLRKRATAVMTKRQHPHRVEIPAKLPKVDPLAEGSMPPLPELDQSG